MYDLASDIMNNKVPAGALHLYWLGGAGFILKSSDATVGVDLFLTDSCRDQDGRFKRIVPPPLSPDSLDLDYLIASHDHGDHLDVEAGPVLIGPRTHTRLFGPRSVVEHAVALGISAERISELNRGDVLLLPGISLHAVTSDHGEYSADAIGVVFTIAGKTVYFTGDTCYYPRLWRDQSFRGQIDVMLVPINGNAGNTDSRDAAHFCREVGASAAIPCHYWIFKEFTGSPSDFVAECAVRAPKTKVIVPAIGERVVF